MEIIIDEREKSLYDLCQQKAQADIKISKCVLTLGDILIKKNNIPLFLIERKTYSDLFASIKDGRYKEQSYRLKYSTEWKPFQILYLLEGTYSQIPNGNKKIVLSAITSLSLFKGFHIIRSTSVSDSVDILLHMVEKIWKETEKGELLYSSDTDKQETNKKIIDINEANTEVQEILKPYSSVVKSVKKENITPENIGEIMLCQIPGIQTKTASAIMKTTGSFPELFRILQESPEIIEKIRVGERKINKNVLTKLTHFLLSIQKETDQKDECKEN
jgi:ERCC4-type nuclease